MDNRGCFGLSRRARDSERGSVCHAAKASSREIYQFLCRSLRNNVSVSLIVDLNVLDVVPVGDIYLAVDIGDRRRSRGLCTRGRGRRRYRIVNVSAAFPGLELFADSGCNRRCFKVGG